MLLLAVGLIQVRQPAAWGWFNACIAVDVAPVEVGSGRKRPCMLVPYTLVITHCTWHHRPDVAMLHLGCSCLQLLSNAVPCCGATYPPCHCVRHPVRPPVTQRCWAQNPSDRPRMPYVVEQLQAAIELEQERLAAAKANPEPGCSCVIC